MKKYLQLWGVVLLLQPSNNLATEMRPLLEEEQHLIARQRLSKWYTETSSASEMSKTKKRLSKAVPVLGLALGIALAVPDYNVSANFVRQLYCEHHEDIPSFVDSLRSCIGNLSPPPKEWVNGCVSCVHLPLGEDILANLLGTGTAIAEASLAGYSVHELLESSFVDPDIRDLESSHKWRRVSKIGSGILSFLSASNHIYFAHLAYPNHSAPFQIIMGVPASFKVFMYLRQASGYFVDKIFNRCTTSYKQRDEIVAKFRSYYSHLLSKECSDAEFSAFCDDGGDDELSSKILQFKQFCDNHRDEIVLTSEPRSKKRQMFNALGFIIGGISSAVSYKMSEGQYALFLDWMGLDATKYTALGTTYAVLGTIPWAILGSEATQERFDEIYTSVSHNIRDRKFDKRAAGKFLLTSIPALCAVIPWAYVTYSVTEEWGESAQALMVASAVIGSYSVRYRAFDRFIGTGRQVYNHLTGKDKRYYRASNALRRTLTGLTRMKNKIFNFFEEMVNDEQSGEAFRMMYG